VDNKWERNRLYHRGGAAAAATATAAKKETGVQQVDDKDASEQQRSSRPGKNTDRIPFAACEAEHAF